MKHDVDPKEKLLNELGDISSVELFNNQILVAVYMRPKVTKGGIHLTDQYTDEDRHQSKVGLLVKQGPTAFQDTSGEWFAGENFNLNDWLVFRPSDGWSITVHGVLCRILSDTQIKGRTAAPDEVW
jgi:co-chaperonin GroES (HSP10)